MKQIHEIISDLSEALKAFSEFLKVQVTPQESALKDADKKEEIKPACKEKHHCGKCRKPRRKRIDQEALVQAAKLGDHEKMGAAFGASKCSAIETKSAKLRALITESINKLGAPTVKDLHKAAEAAFPWYRESRSNPTMLAAIVGQGVRSKLFVKSGYGSKAHVMFLKK